MDTIQRIEAYCKDVGYELHGIGIPKTVDNDLFGTDHTPGFASAARTNILSVKEAGILARDMQKVDQFVIYQTIGRDAGWLAAATALAKKIPQMHLISSTVRNVPSIPRSSYTMQRVVLHYMGGSPSWLVKVFFMKMVLRLVPPRASINSIIQSLALWAGRVLQLMYTLFCVRL